MARSDGRRTSRHAVFGVRNSGSLDRSQEFQLRFGTDALEEPRAPAENKWDDMKLQFVDVPSREELVDHVRTAADEDILAFGGFFSSTQRGVDPVRNEGEGGVRQS